ncbi:MAG TPA: VapE family protein [Leptospiraceae bacterium]|nr:VapE family protein [Leptospiraceae bacterium]HNN76712.1 VapE family protein [Leptospiraceae bacterium]
MGPRFLHVPGPVNYLYNEDTLFATADKVVIAEGIADCVTAEQYGFRSVAVLGARAFKEAWKDKLSKCTTVYVCLDSDTAGQEGAEEICKIIGPRARNVLLPVKDINDFFFDHSAADFQRLLDTAQPIAHDAGSQEEDFDPIAQVRELLQFTERGAIKRNLYNVVTILQNDPRWKGLIAYDNFENQIRITRKPPWGAAEIPMEVGTDSWTENDDARLAIDLSRTFQTEFSAHVIAAGVSVVAQTNAIHPVRTYLDSLRWDGVPRISTFLAAYFGVVDSPYARLVGSLWMVSAVARIYEPGCKADCLLIFEGSQGLKKSSGSRALVGAQWFSDTPLAIGAKDGYEALRGKWIIELPELDSLNRAELSRIKAFFSSGTDRFRPSYGRRSLDFPRQCVFCGTVNHADYLQDVTGNRRFWPVRCNNIRLAAIENDRDQLWAEAVHLYRNGAKWWPSTDEERALCAAETEDRLAQDPWLEIIQTYLEPRETTSVNEILEEALDMKEPAKWGRREQTRVGLVLAALKWERRRLSEKGQRKYRYYRPEPAPPALPAIDNQHFEESRDSMHTSEHALPFENPKSGGAGRVDFSFAGASRVSIPAEENEHEKCC